MGKRKKAGKSARRGRSLVAVNNNPPQYRAITTFRRKFRFYVNSTFSGTLCEAQLLRIPGVMCTVVNTTCVAMQISVKVHSIKIWGVAGADAAANTISIRPFGVASAAANNLAEMDMVADTTTNAAYTPYVCYVPKPGSRLAFWLSADNSGTDELVYLTMPAKSIVEFDLSFNHGMPPQVGSFSVAVVTGTLGTMYWLALTAISGTGVITPLDLSTTS